WIDVEGGIAAVIHVVATIELPVVVLGAAAVHAVSDVAIDADLAFIRAGLVDDSRSQSDELGEIAAVQHELIDLLAGHGRAEGGRLRFHLGYTLAGYYDFFVHRPHGQL